MPDGMAKIRQLAQAFPAVGPGPGLDTDIRDPAQNLPHFLDARFAAGWHWWLADQ